MRRARAGAALLLLFVACGPAYPPGGRCQGDGDCQLCLVCDCERPYSAADLRGASCAQVAREERCPRLPRDACLTGPSYQALCVSGFCQAVQR